jgi:hypothetical protein
MTRMKRGDEVKIGRGTATGTSCPERMHNAAGAYKGDMAGAKGVVIGTEVRSTDGVEVSTVAVTDCSKDGRPTGLVDVPTARLRHTGFRHDGVKTAASARCFGVCASEKARDNWDRVFGNKKREPSPA